MATKKAIPGKKDKTAQDQRHPVREGQENSSVLSDKHPPDDKEYPHIPEKDKQVKNQPEFIESDSNRKQKDDM